MSLPGFTAEESLYQVNERREPYTITAKDTSARGDLVIGQLSVGILPAPRQSLELECPPCVRGNSTVSCSVVSVSYLTSQPTRTYLGRVVLPRTCWGPCIN
jgi:hypothetical protein